jgi:hypothetical protein
MKCDQPDDRAADAPELQKLSMMIRTFGFHGLMMLSKPCAKCNMLHGWRMITTLPPDEGHVQELLRHAAAMVDEGIPEKFEPVTSSAPQ